MNTAVLFMCHIINDEAKFRYELLKKGCKEMGYDLLWAIDTMAIPEENLPKDIGVDFYPISYLRYEKLFPYMTFIEDENRIAKRTNGGITLFNSGYFMYKPNMTKEYTEYVVGKVYHPVKLNINWKNVHNWS